MRPRVRRAHPARADPGPRAGRPRPEARPVPRAPRHRLPRRCPRLPAAADGQAVHHGGLTLTSTAALPDVEAHGLRAACAGRVLACSGDGGPCAALTGPARDADLFRCEAGITGHRESERVHLAPQDAGDTVRRAGTRELPVTHVGPTPTPEAATARAAAAFGGPAAAAREGRTYAV
ncbi:hypothetical protein AB0420_29635 [Streptomyces caelestis]|uniref:MBL fold metallo-hydrolase n=1 Tax=Streptomyces caelestis TaxID=36816 RepID=UPI00344C2414